MRGTVVRRDPSEPGEIGEGLDQVSVKLSGNGLERQTMTRGGDYVFENIPEGTYELRLSSKRFVFEHNGQRTMTVQDRDLAVPPVFGDHITHIVSGTVSRKDTNRGLPNVTVELYAKDTFRPVQQTTTSAQGVYRLEKVREYPANTAWAAYTVKPIATGQDTFMPATRDIMVDRDVSDVNFSLQEAAANRPPEFTQVAEQTVVEGGTVEFIVKATDPEGQPVSYEWGTPLRAGESVKEEKDPDDGKSIILRYRWENANRLLSSSGKYLLPFSATDGQGGSGVLHVILTVTEKPKPKLAFHPDVTDKTVDEGQTVAFQVLQIEQQPSAPTASLCSASNLPIGVKWGDNRFEWTTDFTQAGTYQITFTCPGAEPESKTITITVRNVPKAPQLTEIPPHTGKVGEPTIFTAAAKSFTPTYSPSSPSGAFSYTITPVVRFNHLLDPVTGIFRWVPDVQQGGTYQLEVTFTDAEGSDKENTTLTVGTPSLQFANLKFIGDQAKNLYRVTFDVRTDERVLNVSEAEALLLTAKVLSEQGTVVRMLADNAPAEPFHYQGLDRGYGLTWDGKDAQGQAVATGSYRLELTVSIPSWQPVTVPSEWFPVRPPQPPIVTLSSPADGATFAAPATIPLAATVSDMSYTSGSIAKVEFFHGTLKLGEDATAPYEFAWTDVAPGAYPLTAKATNERGEGGTSAVVTVTVTPPPPQEAYFVIGTHPVRNREDVFIVQITDPATIQQAQACYAQAQANPQHPLCGRHITGVIVSGNGGFNTGWSWHLQPETVRLAEISKELCDGGPMDVEREGVNFDAGRFCPWSSYVLALGREPPAFQEPPEFRAVDSVPQANSPAEELRAPAQSAVTTSATMPQANPSLSVPIATPTPTPTPTPSPSNVDQWLERETPLMRRMLDNASRHFDGHDQLTVQTLRAVY
ncbi:MAG: hypothetical protein HY595_03055, partial [Candidatus Omnitrophica bacterium]|nr:hypothetical protein [Candidatus Omnitrophota bacterium]